MDHLTSEHPIVADIWHTMIAEGYTLFELFHAEIERFSDGEINAEKYRQETLEWASSSLRTMESAVQSQLSGTFAPLAPQPGSIKQFSAYIQNNGGLETLIRHNAAMFSLEIEGNKNQSSHFSDLSAADARKLQNSIFRDRGYVIKNRQGYSFLEFGRKKGIHSPFTIYFAPFNLKKDISTMSANLVCNFGAKRSLIIVPHSCLFPFLRYYERLNCGLAAIYRINMSELIKFRTNLHIRLLEMLMAHLDQYIPEQA